MKLSMKLRLYIFLPFVYIAFGLFFCFSIAALGKSEAKKFFSYIFDIGAR